MSQIILVGSTGFLLFCAAYPETISNRLEEYKEQLTKRRHDRMLEFMMSDRPYLTGDLKDQLELAHEKGAANTSLLFKGEICEWSFCPVNVSVLIARRVLECRPH
ncbi:hypothetical protein BC830DRAFT_292357 [Chytriomyces sp. MP71]|nr:hypothetical protein BC830DRAFT_292357 [Chytriomyces sp. MP71]